MPVRDISMHVAEAGPPQAPTLLLLHGFAQHWWQWRHLIGDLAGHYRLVCPDQRGWGWTDAPPGEYRKEELAADYLALLDVLELDRVGSSATTGAESTPS